MADVDHGKGEIRDNAIKALVRSNVFRHKVEKSKKQYKRKDKHKKSHKDGFQ